MKANELMIRDWVQVPRELNRIKQIKSTFDMDSAVLYRPISITPEILEKNGFEKDEDDHWCIYNDYYDIELYEYSDNIWVFLYQSNEFADLPCTQNVISYVHELQHALRLCGIDKMIEL